MNDCVFCKIVAGDSPATIIQEVRDSLVIVPLNPVVEGHLIVIPKKHVADAHEEPYVTAKTMLDAADYSRTVNDDANFITSVGKPATQSVFHLHIHIVPRSEDDGLKLPWSEND